ncbi:MAG: hypothetical protein JSR85_02995 [Proteobacteria bacterium]|nr:hypothetical protein [Pseudomonadota bacterium]
MKLKFLSLFLALGMLVLGTSVHATDAKKLTTEGVTDPAVIKVIDYLNSPGAQGSSAVSVACTILGYLSKPCTPCNSMSDIAACVAADKDVAPALGKACDAVCGKWTCKVGVTAQACQAVCCAWDANYKEVKACMDSSGLKCAAPPPPPAKN